MSRRAFRALTTGTALAGLTLTFCGADDEACAPGKQESCACPGGGQGVQICRADGSGFEACAGCPDADGGAQDGSSAGGAGGGGGAAGGSGAAGAAGAAGSSAGGSAGVDAGTPCPAGEATDAVTDECDVALQDCGPKLTCTIDVATGGGYRTVCQNLGDGAGRLGELCDAHSDCTAGLRCTLRKCTRPCCQVNEVEQCGSGACDLQINFGDGDAFLRVCTFSPPCTPWAGDCPVGPESDCHLGFDGSTSCTFPNYAPDGGSTHGAPCVFTNDCEDSQHCSYEAPSATEGTCRWLCKVKDEGAPTAGVVGGPEGQGGCPTGQTCRAFQAPDWLGVCRP